jgi:very-short-patch-repair endonuclease
MNKTELLVNDAARLNYGLTDRATVLALGGTDRIITSRLQGGQWSQIHPGVYLIDVTPLSWHGRLRAATLAAGEAALASHRAALVLWGMEGISSAPLELTVPVGRLPKPEGVIVHRTRRPIPPAVVEGIPVSSAERTILDAAWALPPLIVEQAYESAVRRGLTTPLRMAECLAEQGTWGVRGRGVVARMLDARRPGRPSGSPAETLLLHRMRKAGIDEPVRQYPIPLPDGTVAVVDFAWPWIRRAVEVDGLDAHASASSLEYDLERQNLLFDVHWELRRFSARAVRRHPHHVTESIIQFLAAAPKDPHAPDQPDLLRVFTHQIRG